MDMVKKNKIILKKHAEGVFNEGVKMEQGICLGTGGR